MSEQDKQIRRAVQKVKQSGLNVLLPVPPSTGKPGFVDTSYMARVVEQVNRNTVALQPPRDAAEALAQAQNETWIEFSRTTETITVTDPLEPDNTLDVKRTTASRFFNSEGQIITLIFDNSLADE